MTSPQSKILGVRKISELLTELLIDFYGQSETSYKKREESS